MISVFIKEQKRYSQDELISIFKNSKVNPIEIIRKLKEFGILKLVKASNIQLNMSDLVDVNTEVVDVVYGDNNYYYVFSFVGVITVAGFVIKCYPKYIKNSEKPLKELKQILKVIEKYNRKEQIIKIFNEDNKEQSFNILAVLIYLINDYYENGIYINSQDITETNGIGEILWEKTVNDTFAILSQNRPYYVELQTHKRVNDDDYYIKRLHECILTEVSQKLQDAEITYLFDITPVNLTDVKLPDLGDDDYILYQIEKELNKQFNTRKQILLKMLYAYICNKSSIEDIDCFSMYGTNAFNLIWENVCANAMGNVLEYELRLLNLPIPLDQKYNPYSRLISLIDKPYWSAANKETNDTLIPDFVSIYKHDNEYQFIIFDAKYYTPRLELGQDPLGQPGIESITKQYLYQQAFKDFVKDHKINIVKNCFLMPTCETEVIDKGYVSLSMLKNIGLEDIQIRYIPANTIYDLYLNNKLYDIQKLSL